MVNAMIVCVTGTHGGKGDDVRFVRELYLSKPTNKRGSAFALLCQRRRRAAPAAPTPRPWQSTV